MATNHNSLYQGDPLQSERFESALYFIRSLQEQACIPKLDPFSFPGSDCSTGAGIGIGTGTSSKDNYIGSPLDGGSLTVATTASISTKDAMLATTTLKLQPTMSVISGGRAQPRRSSTPVTGSPPSAAGRSHSPRCSICPYEWDGKLPNGLGGAKIYRLNPSPGESKREI